MHDTPHQETTCRIIALVLKRGLFFSYHIKTSSVCDIISMHTVTGKLCARHNSPRNYYIYKIIIARKV